MRYIFSIMLLSAIFFNEGVHIVLFTIDGHIDLCDAPMEENSEKEAKEKSLDDILKKKQHHSLYIHLSDHEILSSRPTDISLMVYAQEFKEVNFPPPDLV